MGEEITISRRVESPSVSLAVLLKNQYSSKEINDIFASTELREHEIVGLAGVWGTRFVSWILATSDWQLQGINDLEEKKRIEERLLIKKMIMADVNAMAFVIQDSYLYAFGLARQSLKRQSRQEAKAIAMGPRPLEPVEEMGARDKLLTKFGVSRKYRNVPVER